MENVDGEFMFDGVVSLLGLIVVDDHIYKWYGRYKQNTFWIWFVIFELKLSFKNLQIYHLDRFDILISKKGKLWKRKGEKQ